MSYIEKCLSEVEKKLRTKPVEEVRENVLKAIVGLKKDYPMQKTDIDAKFKEICKECNVDLSKEIKNISDIDSLMTPIKTIICSQTVEECREIVFEDIWLLKFKYCDPKAYIDAKFYEEYIDTKFKEICSECHVDFFKEKRK